MRNHVNCGHCPDPTERGVERVWGLHAPWSNSDRRGQTGRALGTTLKNLNFLKVRCSHLRILN